MLPVRDVADHQRGACVLVSTHLFDVQHVVRLVRGCVRDSPAGDECVRACGERSLRLRLRLRRLHRRVGVGGGGGVVGEVQVVLGIRADVGSTQIVVLKWRERLVLRLRIQGKTAMRRRHRGIPLLRISGIE